MALYILMSQAETLREYYPFDDGVLSVIEKVAAGQRNSTWADYARKTKVPKLERFAPISGNPIEVLDFIPKDYDGVYAYHAPMGCVLDSNMAIHAATLAEANPNKRIIAFGSPGSPIRGSGKLKLSEMPAVWKGNLEAVVRPPLEYLYEACEDEAVHIGASFGAEKAAASAQFADKYDQRVSDAVMVEPIAVKSTNALAMALNWARAGKHVDRHVYETGSVAYYDARERSEGMLRFYMGLERLSNLAIGHAMLGDSFEDRVEEALSKNPEFKAHIIWGAESEIAIDGVLKAIVDRLGKKHPENVDAMRMRGGGHAMNLNIMLNTAIVMQALRNRR